MSRPWMGALCVVLVLAAAPAAAWAQDAPPDPNPPNVAIAAPTDGATYTQGEAVQVAFACDDPSGVASCVGSTANGAMLDTSTAGPGTFTVTATDTLGNTVTLTRSYTVVVSGDGGATGDAPPTLTLTLGAPAGFGQLIPGAAATYTATTTAHVVSSAGDALLTVADPSDTATGHLVNGAYALPQALEAAATSATGTGGPPAAIGGLAAPTSILTWTGPANEDVALTFTQPIAATDVLRTGTYGKTLTFTLSTTQP